jgi:hypothetical protein
MSDQGGYPVARAALEKWARSYEERAVAIWRHIAELDQLANENEAAPATLTPVSATSAPAKDNQPTITSAVLSILRDASTPLHVSEIVRRLQERGIHRDLDYEKSRLSVVGVIKGRSDVARLGAGHYQYRGGQLSIHLPVKKERPPVTTVGLITTLLYARPGLTSAEVADEVTDAVQSDAKDRRKLVHSVLNYLITRTGKVHKNEDGRLYLREVQTGSNNGLATRA